MKLPWEEQDCPQEQKVSSCAHPQKMTFTVTCMMSRWGQIQTGWTLLPGTEPVCQQPSPFLSSQPGVGNLSCWADFTLVWCPLNMCVYKLSRLNLTGGPLIATSPFRSYVSFSRKNPSILTLTLAHAEPSRGLAKSLPGVFRGIFIWPACLCVSRFVVLSFVLSFGIQEEHQKVTRSYSLAAQPSPPWAPSLPEADAQAVTLLSRPCERPSPGQFSELSFPQSMTAFAMWKH